MPAPVTTDRIWKEVQAQLFAVLGFVNPKGEARTSGIVYVVRNRQLYIIVGRHSWKARHIARNPKVSLTVTIPKRIPFLPWIKIPAATITFQGDAEVHASSEIDPEIRHALTRDVKLDPDPAKYVIIKVKPSGEFLTYGIGVTLPTMRKPEEASGRAPV